jgi:hypothetical protein
MLQHEFCVFSIYFHSSLKAKENSSKRKDSTGFSEAILFETFQIAGIGNETRSAAAKP